MVHCPILHWQEIKAHLNSGFAMCQDLRSSPASSGNSDILNAISLMVDKFPVVLGRLCNVLCLCVFFFQISCGDVFKDAPAANAIVSPANSFGFMDGGIDLVRIDFYTKVFTAV